MTDLNSTDKQRRAFPPAPPEAHQEHAANAYLVLNSWAGRTRHPVEIVGETPKKLRVRILETGGVALPGRRFARCGDVVLVPKTAVVSKEGD